MILCFMLKFEVKDILELMDFYDIKIIISIIDFYGYFFYVC